MRRPERRGRIGRRFLKEAAVERARVGVRHDRVLRLAWTLSDLAGQDRPGKAEINTALTLRDGGTP